MSGITKMSKNGAGYSAVLIPDGTIKFGLLSVVVEKSPAVTEFEAFMDTLPNVGEAVEGAKNEILNASHR